MCVSIGRLLSQVILQDTGALMVKTTKANSLRADMPNWLLLLRRQEETRLFSGPIPPDPYAHNKPFLTECVVCGAAAEQGHTHHVELCIEEDLYICRNCITPWHPYFTTIYTGDESAMSSVVRGEFVCPECRD